MSVKSNPGTTRHAAGSNNSETMCAPRHSLAHRATGVVCGANQSVALPAASITDGPASTVAEFEVIECGGAGVGLLDRFTKKDAARQGPGGTAVLRAKTPGWTSHDYSP